MAAVSIGGAEDNMLSMRPENAGEEPAVKTCGVDGAWSDPDPVKLESLIALASTCTMAGDGIDKCPNQLLSPVKEEIMHGLCTEGAQEDEPVSQTSEDEPAPQTSDDCDTATTSNDQLAALIERAEEVLRRGSLATIQGSPDAQEPGTVVMPLVPQVKMEAMPQMESDVKVQEKEYESQPAPVIQAAEELPSENQNCLDAVLHTPPPQENLDCDSPCQVAEAPMECLTTVTSLPESSPLSVQRSWSNPSHQEMPDLGVFSNSITDSTPSYSRVGNLQPTISSVSRPSLDSFSGFSQQQAVTDPLPNISTLASSNLVHSETSSLNSCTSSCLSSGNMMNNVVYAAVPLQQTASGMQLAPMHHNANRPTYNLARPSGASRRVLLPRGRSSSNTPNENSFKKTITPLTYEKPNMGLVQQIMEVFRATGRKEMQPCEVYDGLECCYPYYLRMNPNRKKSWMSSVRHALTTPCFKSRRAEDSDGKLAPRKGSFWSINESYDPNSKPLKRVTPVKRPLSSPTYQRRQPLRVSTQQANWQPFPGHNQQQHSTRHSPYNYFSPTRGSFSPVGPSSIPVVYSPTRVYQQQTPTAALLPSGNVVYLSPADDSNGCHPNQSFGRDVYQAWGADANTSNTQSLWQIVQSMGNDPCKDQADQNKIFSSAANGVQQQAVANMNCNNTAVISSLGLINQQQQQQQQHQQQDQLKLQLLQQAQLQQQQLHQQQQPQQQQPQQQQPQQQQPQQQQQVFQSQQQSAADSDPFAVALELSEIKGKQESTNNSPQHIKPQQPGSTNNVEQAITVEMTCSTGEPQTILVETSNSAQQPATKGDSSRSQQQRIEELRSMVYHSLGICNDLNARPSVSNVAQPTQLTATPVTQLSALPAAQYQLIHYSGSDTQYQGVAI